MGFRRRFSHPEMNPPMRIYIHEKGLDNVFAYADSQEVEAVFGRRNPIDIAHGYVLGIVQDQPEIVRPYHYLIVDVWGDTVRHEKVAAFSAFFQDSVWPGNPDITMFAVRNGIHTRQGPVSCGDTAIILGIEERYRRKTHSLEEYMKVDPQIPLDQGVIAIPRMYE